MRIDSPFKISAEMKKLILYYSIDKVYKKSHIFWKEVAETTAVERIYHKMRKADIIYDIATGHGFLPAVLALKMPGNLLIGLDIKEREHWYNLFYPIRNLLFIAANAYSFNFDILKPEFITAIHPCRNLAIHIIELAHKYDCPIILMPCCIEKRAHKRFKHYDTLQKILNHSNLSRDRASYVQWCLNLAIYMEELGYKVRVLRPRFLKNYTDKDIILYGR